MTDSNVAALETAVEAFLLKEQLLTPEKIREWIEQFRVMPMLTVTDEEADALARRLETRHDVTMPLGSVLVSRDYQPWLEAALAGMDFYYWDRYRKLLESKGFSSQVLSTLNSDTDRTLGLLENPHKEGPWSRRGMVVGHVQSGKTANYTGLICKAADAGYRLIVVIAGVHNNLRNQTQKRIDEGFVGRDSARLLSQREDRFVGVGRIDARRRPVTFTNSVRDFSKAMATGVAVPLQNLNEPAVFVIKKNSNTLKNLLEWLREHNASRGGQSVNQPMLVIDDEADNASINVRYDKDEVSTINRQIRELLQMFTRSCYVGYTATPFANIFIDPDSDDTMMGQDLFPRHFIVSLDPPSNYFGADKVFREDTKSVVRHIDDNEELLPIKHVKDFPVVGLPQSLKYAVRTFIVGRAIRLVRGHQGQHCSMLVNASRFTGVQGQIRSLIQRFMDDVQAAVRLHCALPTVQALKDPEVAALKKVMDDEFATAAISWDKIQNKLLDAAAPIRVVEVNSRSHGTLNYDEHSTNGLNVIAVGGFSLSRGLTLEGLMVSYFLRNSMMYDTLMQMGRWFGYRPDYEDLCRIWMPEEAEGWYAHVAESIEMLREELRTMAAAGATPEEFGLKVRAHPDTLVVTARNKMGSGENVIVRIGLDRQFVETATLKNDSSALEKNRRAAQDLAKSMDEAGLPISSGEKIGGSWFIRDVPVAPIREFLAAFDNHPSSLLTDPGPIGRYIEDREDSELALWDVLIAGTNPNETHRKDNSLGAVVFCQKRTAGSKSDERTLRITNKQRVASRGVERTGLSADAVADAEREYRSAKQIADGESVNYPDRAYRAYREKPLLIIHLLEMLKNDAPIHDKPAVAWSIGFPKSNLPEKRVEYVVTTQWMRENLRDDSDDEEPDLETDDV
jgi:hypothetical protein